MGKRFVTFLVVLSLISVILTTGCSNNKNKGDNSVNHQTSTTIGKELPVGKWDIPIPFINPLGAQSDYEEVEYEKDSDIYDMSYIDGIQEKERTLFGNRWVMEVNKSIEYLQKYITELGGKTYYRPNSGMVFSVEDTEGNLWWSEAQPIGEGYRLTVYKEIHLKVGKPLKIHPKDYGSNRVVFATNHPGDFFQSLVVEFPDGEIRVACLNDTYIGGYRRSVSYSRDLFAERSTMNVLDDIPQEAGSVFWKLSWNNNPPAGDITITLQENEKLDPVKVGEHLGALRVRGVTYGDVTVEPASYLELDHSEMGYENYYGDITPEGDTIFFLPSGYWNVITETNSRLFNGTSRLIPVNEGELTVVDMPEALKTTFSNERDYETGNLDNSDKVMGELEVVEARDLGSTAEITFMLYNPNNRDVTPIIDDTHILESGESVSLVSIERLNISPNIVLLLDSSGSMRGEMSKTIEAAKKFVQGLSDDASIKLIDFDTEPKLLKGTTKSQALKNLDNIKANGATALYDSIIEGLNLLQGEQRPTLLVFTDGNDSNWDDSGPGSKATKEEVIEAVKDANIPLYTIGFGATHDKTTLLELATLSNGKYFPAMDQTALNKVFASINSQLGNLFKAVYERPKKIPPSDVPIISLVIDTSGSMNMDPSDQGCGWRIQKVKNLFHDFILDIPEESYIQLINFSEEIEISQALTSEKPQVLQALGSLRASGGTDILGSSKFAYETLKPVPSTQRVIIYLTDAALEVDDNNIGDFEATLRNIREQNIKSLWVGLGVEENKDAFEWAAETSGGKYIISEDVDVLKEAFEKVLTEVNDIKPSDKTILNLNIDIHKEDGKIETYGTSCVTSFEQPEVTGKPRLLDGIRYTTGEPLTLYDKDIAQLIYGTDVPTDNVKIRKRIPLNVIGSNKTIELKALEAYQLKAINGITAPDSYMVLNTEITNNYNVPYLIPDISSHFYISMNDEGSYPASPATWLAEKPITPPGETGITIKPGETISGAMIFIVRDDPIENLALNFYDTEYGHINLPLIGEINKEEIELVDLPKSTPSKLSDAFSLNLKAFNDVNAIDKIEATQESVFRIIEGNFTTKVQALLNINPSERFSMRINTDNGPFQVPISPVTSLIPYGFLQPILMAPGSQNQVRMVFQIPEQLAEANQTEIFVDLGDGDVTIPIKDRVKDISLSNKEYMGDGMSLVVNQLSKASYTDIGGYGTNWVIADVTVTDTKDDYATGGLSQAFTLVREDHGEELTQSEDEKIYIGNKGLGNFSNNTQIPETLIEPHEVNSSLLLGVKDNWIVYDGEMRRGLIAFELPDDDEYEWSLQSPYFEALDLSVSNEEYSNKDLLAIEIQYENNDEFNEQLTKAIQEAIDEYNDIRAAELEGKSTKKIGLNLGSEQDSIDPPTITMYGATKIKSINTIKDFQTTMEELRWVPTEDEAWEWRYSPQAVLTQKWGTSGALANLAEGLLARLGFRPERRLVELTNDGIDALKEVGKVDDFSINTLPAISYRNEKGENKVFIIPFMKDISELNGLVYLPQNQKISYWGPEKAEIKIDIEVIPKTHDVQSKMDEIAQALGAESDDGESYSINVLSTWIELDELSMDAIDVGYAAVNESSYAPFINTKTETIIGDSYIDSKEYFIVGTKITVYLSNDEFVHEKKLNEDEKLDGIFHTLAINLPDLHGDALDSLEKATNKEYKTIKDPKTLSTLKWYTRNIINRFISGQTKYENELAKDLDITVGRTNKERIIVLTVQRENQETNKFQTSIDLLQSFNQVHKGNDEAIHAFNIMSGLYASTLEGLVIPGDSYDFYKIWNMSPEGTMLLVIDGDYGRDNAEVLKENGFPEVLVEEVLKGEKVIFVPNQPAKINGEERWAWLEIDMDTYETISVLDTGEHGGLAEYAITETLYQDMLEGMFGAFLGIEVSIWSVANYSLKLEEYDEIKEAAKAYAGFMGKKLSAILDSAKGAGDMIDGNVGVGGAPLVGGSVSFKDGVSAKLTLGGNLFGFSQGYEAGVNYYFEEAE